MSIELKSVNNKAEEMTAMTCCLARMSAVPGTSSVFRCQSCGRMVQVERRQPQAENGWAIWGKFVTVMALMFSLILWRSLEIYVLLDYAAQRLPLPHVSFPAALPLGLLVVVIIPGTRSRNSGAHTPGQVLQTMSGDILVEGFMIGALGVLLSVLPK